MKNLNIKKQLTTAILLGMPFLGFSQGKESSFDLASIMVGVVAIALLIGLISTLMSLNSTILNLEMKRAGVSEKKDTTPTWQRLKKKLTDIVPVEKEADILLDHNYDGIQELDNTLPPWWLYGFYLSIAISVFYIGYYHYYDQGFDSTEQYEYEMDQAQIAINNYLDKQSNTIDVSTMVAMTDPKELLSGEKIFNTNCIACHLKGGGGSPTSVGPNLTDEYWMHGGDIKSIFKTIKYGVPQKGMIAWKAQLKPADIHKVASYILSLQGTNPSNAKAPQGDKFIAMQQQESSSN